MQIKELLLWNKNKILYEIHISFVFWTMLYPSTYHRRIGKIALVPSLILDLFTALIKLFNTNNLSVGIHHGDMLTEYSLLLLLLSGWYHPALVSTAAANIIQFKWVMIQHWHWEGANTRDQDHLKSFQIAVFPTWVILPHISYSLMICLSLQGGEGVVARTLQLILPK